MSGPATFDKFAWLRTLRGDPQFTDKEFRLGSSICIDYVRRDGTGWFVEMDVLASSVPGGLSRNRLTTLLAKFERNGYLVEAGRSGGHRGQTAKRAHNLVARASEPAPIQGSDGGERSTASGRPIGERSTASGSKGNRQRLLGQPPAVIKGASELPEGTPLGTYEGTCGGTGHLPEMPPTPGPDDPGHDPPPIHQPTEPTTTATASPGYVMAAVDEFPAVATLPLPPNHWPDSFSEPEPPTGCRDHPRNDGGPCGACRTAQQEHERWKAAPVAFERTRNTARVQWIRACDGCNGLGQMLGPDGRDADTPRQCTHTPLWSAWWRHRRETRCDQHNRADAAPVDCADCDARNRTRAAS